MSENSFFQTQATSDSLDEAYTPLQMREFVLPRMFLARSLTRHMVHRLSHAHVQEVAARSEVPPARVHSWVAAISTTRALIENTLKLYETIAAHVDTRIEEERVSLQARFMRERDPADEVTFHSRVWMFQQLDFIGDEAFTTAGIEIAEGRMHISHMVERSVAYLQSSERRMREFYGKYRSIVNAYKHGRALFAFVPTETTSGFTLTASNTALTALVARKPKRGRPTRLVTFTADDEVLSDLSDVLLLLDVQVPRFLTLFESFAVSATAYLGYLEGHPPDTHPMIQFSLFGDPYSDREFEVLQAVRGARLCLPEQR